MFKGLTDSYGEIYLNIKKKEKGGLEGLMSSMMQ